MKIMKFREINESHKNEYGCSMIYFELPFSEVIHKVIDEKDIYEDPNDPTYGLETEPHVTLLFGLHSDVNDDEVIENQIPDSDITEITLHNISKFSNEMYDVLKFDAKSDWLYESNEKLRKLPHTTDFPDYHPHCTITYLLPGTSDKYIELLKGVSIQVKPTEFVYSKTNGEKIKNKI